MCVILTHGGWERKISSKPGESVARLAYCHVGVNKPISLFQTGIKINDSKKLMYSY